MLFACVQEQLTSAQHGQPETKSLVAWWCALLMHALCWSIVWCHFLVANARGRAPSFVLAAIVLVCALDALMCAHQYMQQRELGRWACYMYSETVYSLLTLAAQQALAWLVFVGSNSL